MVVSLPALVVRVAQVRRLAMLTGVAVFKDILPGYRIRQVGFSGSQAGQDRAGHFCRMATDWTGECLLGGQAHRWTSLAVLSCCAGLPLRRRRRWW